MYKPVWFKAYELVDSATYKKFGENAIQLFNPLALMAIDKIRERFGVPVTINNWYGGGPFRWRGLRTILCNEGAQWSQHRVGGAFDLDVEGYSAEEVRLEILNKKGCGLITCIEADVNWVHIDVRNIDVSNGILIVHP